MLSIGACKLGCKPSVAVAIRDGISRSMVDAAFRMGGDIIELRIDQFAHLHPDYVLAEIEKYTHLPRIGTIRSTQEGGGWRGTEEQRLGVYEAIIPSVEAVDIELGAVDIIQEVVACANAHRIPVIGSVHNFETTPDAHALAAYLASGKHFGVDIIKIAAHCDSFNDVTRLARLLLDHSDTQMIVIGMGKAGTISRIFFPALGSLLTYTFLGQPSAPGQLNHEDTMQFLQRFYTPLNA